MKNSKIRQSAKGEMCLVRIPGICNFNPETTIYAHIGGGGIGQKAIDLHGAYCCSSCHDNLDGRTPRKYSIDKLKLWHLEGVIRTQLILIKKGYVNYF